MALNIKSALLRFAIATALAALLIFGTLGAGEFNQYGYDLTNCTVQGHIHVPKTGDVGMKFDRVDSCTTIKTLVESNALIISSKTVTVFAIFPDRLPQGRYTFIYVWGAKTAWVNDMVLHLKVFPSN